MFSRFFEAVKASGPELPTNNLIIAINWTGLYLINENEEVVVRYSNYININ